MQHTPIIHPAYQIIKNIGISGNSGYGTKNVIMRYKLLKTSVLIMLACVTIQTYIAFRYRVYLDVRFLVVDFLASG